MDLRYAQLDELLRGALACSGEARNDYVERHCTDDPELRSLLERMIAAAEGPDEPIESLFSTSRIRLLNEVSGEAEDLSGQRFGSWRIVEPIARGGLATVYRALRADGEFEQRVAFKVLRRGLDTDDIVARFRGERQILSNLEHPAISQILDGGTLDDGRPYLVLEYVEGLPITDYCEVNAVALAERVRLAIDVLRAVAHAHRYLVIHRDIKPSNVLVTETGRVALLDFGIAKLLDPTAFPGGSTQTRTGAMLFTPAYATPEQHHGGAVTTATDIYQVGMLLYELIARERPPPVSERSENAPIRPPSRVTGDPAIARAAKGDLDAIVCKAMAFDASRRYVSAGDMASDLVAFLEGKPVSAQPDTLPYRFYKLVRRRPLLLPSIMIVLVLTVGYIVTLTKYNRQLAIEQRRAAAAEAFMVDLLGSANPFAPADPNRGRHITVVEALGIGVERLRSGAYSGDDHLRASLLTSIGDVYENIDEHLRAIDVRKEALSLQRKLYGSQSEPVIRSLQSLGHQYRTTGEYDAAGPYYEEQLRAARAIYPAEDPRLGVAETAIGLFEMRSGDTESSRRHLEAAVPKLLPAWQTHGLELVNAIVDLVRVRGMDALDDSMNLLERAIEIADGQFGPQAPIAGLPRLQMAVCLSLSGEFERAMAYFDKVLEIYEGALGRHHGATLIALSELASHLVRTGSLAAAAELQREVLDVYREKYGPSHRGVATLAQALADTRVLQDEPEAAIPLYEQAHQSALAVLGPSNPLAYEALLGKAWAQLRHGEWNAAAATAADAADTLAPLDRKLSQQATCVQRLAIEVGRAVPSDPEPDPFSDPAGAAGFYWQTCESIEP